MSYCCEFVIISVDGTGVIFPLSFRHVALGKACVVPIKLNIDPKKKWQVAPLTVELKKIIQARTVMLTTSSNGLRA